MESRKPSTRSSPAKPTRRSARLALALAGGIAFAALLWMFVDNEEPRSSSSPAAASGDAEVVSVPALRATAAASATPLYWAGRPAGSRLELSQPSAGRTFVRYLTGGAAAGDPRPFLTIGSYRIADAANALRRVAERAGGVIVKAPEGGVVYFSRKDPRSVYLAYPGQDVEVEVFAPAFQQALRLVTAGRIVPIE